MDLAWMGVAECNGMDRRMFLAPRNPVERDRALAVCAVCPVKTICLMYGLSLEDSVNRYGIFGGETAAQRKEIPLTQDDADLAYRRLLEEWHEATRA